MTKNPQKDQHLSGPLNAHSIAWVLEFGFLRGSHNYRGIFVNAVL